MRVEYGHILGPILGAAILAVMFWVSRVNYPLFHALAEMASIAVAWSVFLLVWNSRRFVSEDALLFLGTAYLFVGLIDLIHTLAYKGMGLFPAGREADLATQLWISARYLQGVSLLLFPLLLGRRLRPALVLSGYAAVTALLLAAIFAWRIFPACFVEGAGLTAFKKVSEYVICLILFGAGWLLFRRRGALDPAVFRLLAASIGLTILSELSFTFYVSVYGLSNLIGHYLKIFAFFLVYLALIRSGLTRPYSLLFRELNQKTEALAESEGRWRSLVEASPDHIVTLDRDLIIRFVNFASPGLTVDRLLGTSILDYLDPSRRDEIEAVLRGVLSARRPGRYETQYRTPDGNRIHYETLATPRMVGGTVQGLLLVARDITARQQAEAALQEREALLNEVGRIAQIGGWEMDLITRQAQWTEATYQIVEIEPGQPIPGPDEHVDFYLPEYRPMIHEAMRALIEDDQPLEFEAALRTAKGNLKWCRALGRAIREDGRAVRLVGTFQDLTERKRLQEQLRESQKLQAIGTLAAGVAHQFNNQMTVVTGFSQLALERLGPDHPARRDILEVQRAGERTARLTRQLLAFSRKQVLEPEVLDLNQVVADMGQTITRLVGPDVELTTDLAPALGPVWVDRSQLEQIIVDLATNAREAMPGGGRLTIATANVPPDEKTVTGPQVRLSVLDTGSGMDPEVREKIFEPFFTTKDRAEKTGLGLSTVYGIVKQSGGDIQVESEPGRGTTFRIYFRPADEAAPSLPRRPTPAAPPTESRVVLVVEDEPGVRSLIAETLTGRGYEVLTAASGEEALEIHRRRPEGIHLLMTDVVMPGMSGRDLVERLTRSNPALKVLFMSGYSEQVVARHGILRAGAAFISKPFSIDELTGTVGRVLQDDQ